jgi:multifunctional methyltransferase subunit TRM112
MLTKVDWPQFRETVAMFGDTLPELLDETLLSTPEFLDLVDKYLFRLQVESGNLACENCGRLYPIENGIPNMLILDEETNA